MGAEIGDKYVSKAEEYSYILKDFGGRPAVFEKGKEEPILTLDVYTNQLPPRDQTRLYGGIKANTLEEILSLAENYE